MATTVGEQKRLESLADIAMSRVAPRTGWLDEATIREMLALTLEAIRRALSSGTLEYHIGSRGLKRYPLADLYKMLDYWKQQLDDAVGGGTSIKSKRIVPTDH